MSHTHAKLSGKLILNWQLNYSLFVSNTFFLLLLFSAHTSKFVENFCAIVFLSNILHKKISWLDGNLEWVFNSNSNSGRGNGKKTKPWLWRSWQSGRFQHCRFAVRIPTSVFFIIMSVTFYRKDEKRGRECPIKNTNTSRSKPKTRGNIIIQFCSVLSFFPSKCVSKWQLNSWLLSWLETCESLIRMSRGWAIWMTL